MESATTRLLLILAKADSLAVEPHSLPACRLLLRHNRRTWLCLVAALVLLLSGAVLSLQLHSYQGLARALLQWRGAHIRRERCVLAAPDKLVEWLRPVEDCSICRGLTTVDRVINISPREFEAEYAYTGRPVIVEDGTYSWPGRISISFKFFKDLYNNGTEQMACQFFPYETEFQSLREVFEMSEDRALMREGTKPWYIGWSNCDNEAAHILKEQYSRPYFLPDTSENKKTDWIFMGSPGYGANMHVDNVNHASWQAQLRGRKKWTLQPPPECIYQCNTLEAIVNPGEISGTLFAVVLDTNRWYHQTLILQGEMSITIGAEYD